MSLSNQILEQLQVDGWKIFKHYDSTKVALYKSFAGVERCYLNPSRDKQVEVYLNNFEFGGIARLSWQVEIVGELPDGTTLRLYSSLDFSADSFAVINNKVQEMLRIWDHAVKFNDHYGKRPREEE